MASRYLEWQNRDVKPEEPLRLTPEQKRKNWWAYHKGYVASGIFVVLFLCYVLWTFSGIGVKHPDYQIAYVGEYPLPEETVTSLQAALAAYGEDWNGDGEVTVKLTQYTSAGGAEAAYAAGVRLLADVQECRSCFFLLENPEQFQQGYHVLCRLDGSLPGEMDFSVDGTYWEWRRCPALSGLELEDYTYTDGDMVRTGNSQALLSRLAIARRGFWTEKTAENPDACRDFWNRLTSGASTEADVS